MTAHVGVLPGPDSVVPEPEEARERESFPALLARLSHQSVVKHFDAYANIDWDSEELRIDADDPRWELPEDDVLGRTAWYRGQPSGVRARIGLHIVATFMKTGIQFENVLERGLLEFTFRLPNHAPEFRYAMHEVIEEGQHSLMFQEFVNRTGLDVPGLPWWHRLASRQIVRLGHTFPELFFVFVMGGEDPIDHVQRQALQSGQLVHPLLRRISQIHVTEEARHLCFARNYLREHVPRLGPVRRFVLSSRAPLLLAVMVQMMMRPSAHIVRTYGIPRSVISEAYTRNPEHRARTQAALRKVRELLAELGLVTPRSQRLWRWLRLWPEEMTV